MAIKEKIVNRVSILRLSAGLLALIGMILYAVNTGDYVATPVVVLALIGFVAAVVASTWRDPFGLLTILGAAVYAACIEIVFASQLNNLTMAATGVLLGSAVPATFYVSAILFFLAIAGAVVAIFLKPKKVS